ncbi:MAG: anthranilate synthase component I, partial [Chloroflexi bacterium HGW-Chloroflexi-7]
MNMTSNKPIPTIIRELHADLETPVSVYLKLRGQGASFLLESVEGGVRVARYSFIGIQPQKTYHLKDGLVEIHEGVDCKVA